MSKTLKQVGKVPMIRDSAQHIWLAGLGAFALAEEEGVRVFDTLVKKGRGVEKMNKARLEKVLAKVGDVRSDAERAIGRLTAPIDTGVNTALHRLGVPSRKEITTLTRRVEELTRSVERNRARRPAARRPRRQVTRRAAPAAMGE